MSLKLKSDVSNDLQQNADQIGSVGKALAEFAWNSIQYQPPGQKAIVRLDAIRNSKGLIIAFEATDNGRGMDLVKGLPNFFTMHASNQDRLQGNPGRGRFGTGAKAAAMAIADILEVDTSCDGKRTVARLERSMLKPGVTEVDIPFEFLGDTEVSGTTIRLRKLRIKRINEDAVRRYLQTSLGRQLLFHDVQLFGEPLVYVEPHYLREWKFTPDSDARLLLGDAELTIRLAAAWLEDDDRGITFLAGGVPHERGFSGQIDNSALAARIYGDVDVPLLEKDDEEGRPAYTADRTLRLNRENLRVQSLLEWVTKSLAHVTDTLESEEKLRRDKLHQEKLERASKTIEEALNRRLIRTVQRLERNVRLNSANNGGSSDTVEGIPQSADGTSGTADGSSPLLERNVETGEIPFRDPSPGEPPNLTVAERRVGSANENEMDNPADAPVPNKVMDPAADNLAKPSKSGGSNGPKTMRPKGSFRVTPKAMGLQAPRAYYAASQMTIYVNTDHPQLVEAGTPLSKEYQLMMAECAAAEFALALTSIRIEHGDPEIDPNQWNTILTAIRRESSETGAELATAFATFANQGTKVEE